MRLHVFVLPFLCNGSTAPVRNTETGPVAGISVTANTTLNAPIPQDVDMYLGIPFADPPVGSLRFKPPQRLSNSWTEPLDAISQPPSCSSAGQEDCLYLNVFAPASASPSSPRAVLMWIFGGGFTGGSIAHYNATSLAASEDVVVVMANYRLGMLGFLASDETFAESGTTGNWGMLDQIAAMEWVQRNIGAFGGDPAKVTIFGESAGAMSVVAHLVSPKSAGLFAGAVIQSGTTSVEMFFQPRTDAQKYGEWFAKTHLNCPGGLSDIECLRRVPSSRFWISASERDGWGAPTWSNPIFPLFTAAPVIDGVFLSDSPMNLAQAGKFSTDNRIPVIIGTTADEGTVFALSLSNIIRPAPAFPPLESQMKSVINYIVRDETVAENIFNTEFPLYKSYYASGVASGSGLEFPEAEFSFISNVIRNVMFACPTATFAEILANNGFPVYMYNFEFSFWPSLFDSLPLGSMASSLGNLTMDQLGAFHASDVPFVMKLFNERNISIGDVDLGNPQALYMTPPFAVPGDAKHAVSDKLSCAWANLAKCGVPDSCGPSDSCGFTWERYATDNLQYLLIDASGSVSMEQVALSGSMQVGEGFPPMDRCNWYMSEVQTPFHDLRKDLNLPGTPDPRLADPMSTTKDASNSMAVSVCTLVWVITLLCI